MAAVARAAMAGCGHEPHLRQGHDRDDRERHEHDCTRQPPDALVAQLGEEPLRIDERRKIQIEQRAQSHRGPRSANVSTA